MALPSVSRSSLRSDRQISHRSSSSTGSLSSRPKVPVSKRSITPTPRPPSSSSSSDDSEPARVRVSVRLRPRNAEDLHSDADFADCVELQPELKRLKLRKNNWNFESYKFDEVFTESASQKRVYEVVAKPVVESVLNGYNGTVMAYGQTGTGKTYTVGRLGKDDPSERGIMVRALEDIISIKSTFDTVEVSYLQLYLESLQDLLSPEKNNIPIVEDPKTGEVSLPGATVIKVHDLDHFLQLLQVGEANRHAANTKMNTESSRSHAILLVYIQRSSQGKVENEVSLERDRKNDVRVGNVIPTILRSKLLIVDLAGSERLDKSGSEGHMLEEAKFINLSLSALGKCINALAENGPHIPTRDSKLTRLLRDSFGGSARTSLIITIGPSARHHAETASTVMFGQRAMKVVNMVKLKEEFDYESLCRKLDNQVDYLTAEIERQQRMRKDEEEEIEKKLRDCQNAYAESEKRLIASTEFLEMENSRLELELKNVLEEVKLHKDHNDLMHSEVACLEMSLKQSKQYHLENSTYQKVLADTTQMYEKKITELYEQLEDEHTRSEIAQEQLMIVNKMLSDHQKSIQIHEQQKIHEQQEIDDLRMKLRDMSDLHEKTVIDIQSLRTENEELSAEKIQRQIEIDQFKMKLQEMCQLHKKIVDENQFLRTEKEELYSVKIQGQNEYTKLKTELEGMHELHEKIVFELQLLKLENGDLLSEKAILNEELLAMREKLLIKEKQREHLEDECSKLRNRVYENDGGNSEDKRSYLNENISKVSSGMVASMILPKVYPSKDSMSGQRAIIAKMFEEVGLGKIVAMLRSEDLEIQIHAVKVVANLAAEDINQQKIVEEGGIDALLMLLESSENTTIQRVASGAIANLAMNEMNQVLIMSKGGAKLLSNIASKTDDPQTLRMVAGAFANLCGNQKLHVMLKEDGGIKALLGMVQSGNIDVVAQVARGMANFAKCESRGTIHGHRKGRSLLMEDGALAWLVANSTINSSSTRRHIELALCHLAQNGDNAQDFLSSGAVNELVRISRESSKEDIRNLARKTFKLNPMFQTEMIKDVQ